jgi:hypothetical protein
MNGERGNDDFRQQQASIIKMEWREGLLFFIVNSRYWAHFHERADVR